MRCVAVTAENIADARAFLERHEETSQFLLSNLAEHGPALTQHHNSGNFKAILDATGQLRAVFVLARRGNLLAQCEGDFGEQILAECAREPIQIAGFVGHEDSVLPVARLFRERNPGFKPEFESREILYRYEWKPAQLPSVRDMRVRFLQASDYDQFAPLSSAYMKEFGLPEQTDEEERRAEFGKKCEKRVQWGLFEEGRLLSKAALNSCGPRIGQVGGVYTIPAFRRRGLSKAVMLHLLEDSRVHHGHAKNILFTGMADVPAQKLYESIGYERIGFFTILFGK